jgi:hypothetical protein
MGPNAEAAADLAFKDPDRDTDSHASLRRRERCSSLDAARTPSSASVADLADEGVLMTPPSVVGADGSDPLPAGTVLPHQPDDDGGGQAVGSYALLLDGTTVEIRPVRSDDLAGLLRLNEQVSDESMYLRFFGVSRVAAEQIATRLCRDPGLEGHALVACLRGEIVGVAH